MRGGETLRRGQAVIIGRGIVAIGRSQYMRKMQLADGVILLRAEEIVVGCCREVARDPATVLETEAIRELRRHERLVGGAAEVICGAAEISRSSAATRKQEGEMILRLSQAGVG